MAEDQDRDQKTEAPTAKRKREAVERGDVLQSRDLGAALVVMSGAAWIALAGPWMMRSLEEMLTRSLSFGREDIIDFDPGRSILSLLQGVSMPVAVLFLMTLIAAVGTPAVLGSLGFRWSAIAFRPEKLNPLQGIKRIFGPQGLIELGKSLAKVIVLGAVGVWLLMSRSAELMTMGRGEIGPALSQLGHIFVVAVLVMALSLVLIAGIDIPAQIIQRSARLRMTKQEIKEEHKETEGSPELRGAIRRRQFEVARGSARKALTEASVVLTNPTHFAVALRYRPGFDPAPIVVARGRGVTAEAIRDLADELDVPRLSYPQLARAIYFTTRSGQMIREDLYIAVATILAFVFNLETHLAQGTPQPEIEVPTDARFDEDGNKQF